MRDFGLMVLKIVVGEIKSIPFCPEKKLGLQKSVFPGISMGAV
jgi:hypothetical protein